MLVVEAGKPIQFARAEVARLIDTLEMAAEESTRIVGEVLPLDITERARGYRGMWQRVPIGPCGFITPWNFPLNLVAHKIAPAHGVRLPVRAQAGEQHADQRAHSGRNSGRDGSAGRRVFDFADEVERLRRRWWRTSGSSKLSFTGSPAVGWELRDRARKKHVTLELGGNAAVVIERDADIDDAVDRCVFGGYYQSGQSCISVQRILVQREIYESFREQVRRRGAQD